MHVPGADEDSLSAEKSTDLLLLCVATSSIEGRGLAIFRADLKEINEKRTFK